MKTINIGKENATFQQILALIKMKQIIMYKTLILKNLHCY